MPLASIPPLRIAMPRKSPASLGPSTNKAARANTASPRCLLRVMRAFSMYVDPSKPALASLSRTL